MRAHTDRFQFWTRRRLPARPARLRSAGLAAVLAAWLMIALSAPASAQAGDRTRLEQELRRTDTLIQEAHEAVARSESERARRLLENAVMVQQVAWRQFERCGLDNLGACRNAAEATTRARREVRHAIQVAREQSGQERAAQQVMDSTRQRLDEALRVLREQRLDNPQALRLLEQAGMQLERAAEQFRERHFDAALGLAQSAARLLQQALNLGNDEHWNPDRIRRELERTERLHERAAPVIHDSGNEHALKQLAAAEQLQVKAQQAFGEQHLLLALRLTRQARNLLQKALRLIEGPADAELVERAIRQADNLIARAEPVIRESGDERAVRLLEKGLDRQRQARDLLDAEQLHAALAQTRVARNLVQQALELVQRGGTP